MSLQFGLLGPVTVTRHGRALALGSPQQRALLALLLLHRNELVSTDRALDALWPAGLPPNALPVLRTYVSRLRATGVPLQTLHHGYELRTDAVDADRFQALLAAGRGRREAGDALAAEALLTEALALVRGPPLPELPDDRLAALERDRLEELRADAAEELVEARLAQGRHRELVPELRAAAGLRERTWGQLMVALYRSGRQAEALAAYRDACRALALKPGEQLRTLERMVLAQDPALELPPALGQPHYATSFVGRDADLAALAAAEDRLITIVGPAGVGKTRLAAELGAARWWVELAAVGPGRVVATVARALAVPELPGRAPIDLIAARAHDSPGLLVLDNCEHVLAEAADLVAHVLEGAPRSRILATSREPLRLGDETVHALRGLDADATAQLFRDRAGTAAIVPELDGLPLAIELAAGQFKSGHVLPARHRTLEAAIAWSVDLLSAREQGVLHALAVFPSSFDADAAEAVSGGTLATLTHLVSASLLVADRGRYRLLQTVRAFADAPPDAARRHRDHYLLLAEEVGRNMIGSGLPVWLPRGRLEHENFSAALRYSLDHGDGEAALQMAGALGWYWFRSSFVTEGRALLEEALALAPDSPWRPRALAGRAWVAVGARAPDLIAVATEAAEASGGDPGLLAHALSARAQGLVAAGRLGEARADIASERSDAAAAGIEEGVIFADQLLGMVELAEGDFVAAEEHLLTARDGLRRLRGTLDAGFTLVELARVKLAQREPEAAVDHATQALADFRRREDPRGVAEASVCLGRAHVMLGDTERGRALLEDARALRERWGLSEVPP